MGGAVEITARSSPNFSTRRHGLPPDMVVLHYTAMASCAAAQARLCDPAYEVSAHYLIAENGEIFQLVAEADRAWHAGAGAWGRVLDVNSHSIGIELANSGTAPFAALQMAALEGLLGEILPRYDIAAARVIGHSDMTPLRKQDPGGRFDWRRLALQGLAVWPKLGAGAPKADSVEFMRLATRFGYSAEVPLSPLLGAFRSRFRPGIGGALNAGDMAIITALAAEFPVDLSMPAP